MKYPRGTVMKWSQKGLRNVSSAGASERLVVLDKTTMLTYDGTEVQQLDMFKTIDSYVELAHESIPTNLTYRRELADRNYEDAICAEFGIAILK